MLFLKFALCLDNFQTYVVYSPVYLWSFPFQNGWVEPEEGNCALGSREVFRFVAGAPNGLASSEGRFLG